MSAKKKARNDIADLDKKLLAVYSELKDFEGYMEGWTGETGRFLFDVADNVSALIEHLDLQDVVKTIIEKRKADFEAEQARKKAEQEAKAAEAAQAPVTNEGPSEAPVTSPDLAK